MCLFKCISAVSVNQRVGGFVKAIKGKEMNSDSELKTARIISKVAWLTSRKNLRNFIILKQESNERAPQWNKKKGK